jgi:hypothetical protein
LLINNNIKDLSHPFEGVRRRVKLLTELGTRGRGGKAAN